MDLFDFSDPVSDALDTVAAALAHQYRPRSVAELAREAFDPPKPAISPALVWALTERTFPAPAAGDDYKALAARTWSDPEQPGDDDVKALAARTWTDDGPTALALAEQAPSYRPPLPADF